MTSEVKQTRTFTVKSFYHFDSVSFGSYLGSFPLKRGYRRPQVQFGYFGDPSLLPIDDSSMIHGFAMPRIISLSLKDIHDSWMIMD